MVDFFNVLVKTLYFCPIFCWFFALKTNLQMPVKSELLRVKGSFTTFWNKERQIYKQVYRFWCSSTVPPIQNNQTMLWRHSFEENHLCQQPSGDFLTATSGLAKNHGLEGTYSVFDPICPLTLHMLSPSLRV